uniref:(northern house mosquito) hypothetical protein n=1 Tax=Culex pipiens TaxID=7175 RepID=A0A8D8II36_CULPI
MQQGRFVQQGVALAACVVVSDELDPEPNRVFQAEHVHIRRSFLNRQKFTPIVLKLHPQTSSRLLQQARNGPEQLRHQPQLPHAQLLHARHHQVRDVARPELARQPFPIAQQLQLQFKPLQLEFAVRRLNVRRVQLPLRFVQLLQRSLLEDRLARLHSLQSLLSFNSKLPIVSVQPLQTIVHGQQLVVNLQRLPLQVVQLIGHGVTVTDLQLVAHRFERVVQLVPILAPVGHQQFVQLGVESRLPQSLKLNQQLA